MKCIGIQNNNNTQTKQYVGKNDQVCCLRALCPLLGQPKKANLWQRISRNAFGNFRHSLFQNCSQIL